MSRYTGGPIPGGPDLELVADLTSLERLVIAEGRDHTPMQAAQAMRAGASAVVIGLAMTRPEHVTSWFSQAIAGAVGDRAPQMANAS